MVERMGCVRWKRMAPGFALLLASFVATPSFAAMLTVQTADEASSIDSRQCTAGSCATLRDAINAAGNDDTIVFAPALDGRTITLSLSDTRASGRAAFAVAGNNKGLTIDAVQGLRSGMRVVRADAAMPFRLFDVGPGARLTLRGLALGNGFALGGGSSFGGGGLGAGGAIFNRGFLFVERCTFFANRARGGNAGDPGEGLYGGGGMDDFARSAGGGGINGGAAGAVGYHFDYNAGPGGAFVAADGAPGAAGGFGGGGGRGGDPGSSTFNAGAGGAGGFGGGGGMAAGIHGQAKGGTGGTGGFGGGAGGSVFNGPGVPGGFGGGTSYGGAGSGDGGAGAGMGGAIFNDAGRVVISISTFTGNSAVGGAADAHQGRGGGYGGAIFNYAGELHLGYATLAGNAVASGTTGIDGGADGGAVYSLTDGQCALGGNGCNPGGIALLGMSNTIAANSGLGVRDIVVASLDAGASLSSGDGNLVMSQDGFAGGIVSSADPLLGGLAAGGGLASVRVPQAASAVIDHASSCAASGYADQRGVVRPQGATCDIGAVEVELPPQQFVGSVTVTTTADQVLVDGQCSLREAVGMVNGSAPNPDCPISASDYNRIVFDLAPGDRTILLGEGTLAFATNAAVVVDGSAADGLMLDGDVHCHQAVALAAGAQVAMLHLAMSRGGGCDPTELDGGAVANDGTLVLFDVRISNSWANGNGGAIANRGWLGIADSELWGNHARYDGGAIHNTGEIALYRVRLHDNVAGRSGGALAVANGSAQVFDSSFEHDHAESDGGAVQVASSATLDVSGSTFSDNQADNQVTAISHGGAIASSGTLGVANATFQGNRVRGSGGALFVGGGTTTATAATFAANTAIDAMAQPRDGASLYAEGGALLVRATIVADAAGSCHGTINDGGGNLASDATCTGFTQGDAMLGALADNGGPTRTMSPAAGSAAIDVVDCAGLPPTDQRGTGRPQGLRCDIGAVEAAIAVALDVDVVGDGDGSVDAGATPAPWTGAITGCDHSGGPDCAATYEQGSVVTLIAQAAAGSTFASWSGDGCVDGGDGTATVLLDAARACTARFTPNAAPTALVASVSPGTSVFGQPVTIDIDVHPSPGRSVSGGAVTLVIDGIEYALALDANGHATGTSDLATIGAHAISASYAGDAANLPSGPVVLTLDVVQAATTTAVGVLPASIPLGTPIDVAAHIAVIAPGQGEPAGTIEIRDDDGSACSYDVALATSCALTPVHAGDRTISARYLGNDEFTASTSAASVITVVGEESIVLSVSDGSDFARYGGTNVYLVSAGNATASAAAGLSLTTGSADGLDAEAGQWCEFDQNAECSTPVAGPFAIAGLTVPAHATRTWAVTIPVRVDAPGAMVDYAVTLAGAALPAPVVRTDSDKLVLFRDGFE